MIRHRDPLTLDEEIEAELREIAAQERAASRRICATCGAMGHHNIGCPDEPPLEGDDD